jgi:hypothetical protein
VWRVVRAQGGPRSASALLFGVSAGQIRPVVEALHRLRRGVLVEAWSQDLFGAVSDGAAARELASARADSADAWPEEAGVRGPSCLGTHKQAPPIRVTSSTRRRLSVSLGLACGSPPSLSNSRGPISLGPLRLHGWHSAAQFSVEIVAVRRRLENAQPPQAGTVMLDTAAFCGGEVGRIPNLPTANPPAAFVGTRGPGLGRGPALYAEGAVRPCAPWEQVGSRAALIPETVPAAWADLPASALGRNRRLTVAGPQIEPGRLAARRSSVPPVFGTQPSRPAVRVLAELRCKPSEGPV